MFDFPISGELLVEEVGQVSLPEGAAGTPTALTSQGSLLCLLQGGHLGQRTLIRGDSYYTLIRGDSLLIKETFMKTLLRGAACVGVRNTTPSRHRGFENIQKSTVATFHLTTLHSIT